MPHPGGGSAKLGERYEGRWTAKAILEVLRENAEAIHLEPLGPDGDGVEFYLRYADRREFHQVKRQRTSKGDWTIPSLKEVLAKFRDHLCEPTAHCWFVSTQSAGGLAELIDCARNAVSWDNFNTHFLVSEARRRDYASLKSCWGDAEDEIVLDMLRRIHIEPIGEEVLKLWTTESAKSIVEGDQSNVLATLCDVVLENVHRYLTAETLWKQLAKHNYRPSFWTRPEQTSLRARAANERYALSRRATLINGELLQRGESAELSKALESNRLVLLDGIAGAGKSDVILQFIEELDASEIPYLAFRLDRTTPTRHPDDLGHELGLPSSPTATLAAVAQERRAVLIIDQLDAVSTTSGRNPEFLECISDVVRSAHSVPNLRVVLVCRTFDMAHDARLLQLTKLEDPTATVTVHPLSLAQLDAPLARIGCPKGTLSDAQLELLRVPLHLALLAGTATGDRKLDFASSLDLHDAFWLAKRRSLEPRFGITSAWTDVVGKLVDYMSEQQVLRAPAAIVDAWEAYVDGMVSANVLTRDGNQLAFFHEAFFDYAFARTFISRRGSLRALLSQDQFLFRRAQVRQLLAHLRASPGDEYKRDLSYILLDPTVRFHLKEVVISWLSQVSPNPPEWDLVRPFLLDEESPLFGRAWRTLISIDWFRKADAAGFVAERLGVEDKFTDRMVSILTMVGKTLPARVAELLAPYRDVQRWWRRTGSVLCQAEVGDSRVLFDLLLHWVQGWGMDDADKAHGVTTVSIVTHHLEKSRSDWGCELLAKLLHNRAVLSTQAGFANPFDYGASAFPNDLHLEMFVGTIASKAPAAFAKHVLPIMLDLIERNRHQDREDRMASDTIWNSRHLNDEYVDLKASILYAAETSFRQLATSEPTRFASILAEHSDTDHETMAYLLYTGMRSAPEHFADHAISFVLADTRRLRVGYSDSPYWATRLLLEATTPFVSEKRLEELEETLLAYYPEQHDRLGRAQHVLLPGIAESRRSHAVRSRIAELARKFEDDGRPVGIIGGTVQSPISADSASRMSDEQWLGAIAKYTADWRSRSWPRDFLKGGAVELSRVLQDEATRDPDRFARLGLRMPDDSNPAYFEALLHGVGNASDSISLEAVGALIERCHRIPNRPCGRAIAHPLRRYVDAELPARLLSIVGWYALHDADPKQDRPPSQPPTGELDLLNHGLNSVRGGIANDIAALVQDRPERAEVLEEAIRCLVSDRVTAVRAMAAEIVCALVRSSPAIAQARFLELIDTQDDRILTTRGVFHYLLWQGTDDFEVLRPVFERMIRSQDRDARKYGAAHMSLAALTRTEAREAADACGESDDELLRLGVTLTAKSNLATSDSSVRCSAALSRAFNDASPEVRKNAADVFWRLKGTQLGDHIELVDAFLASPAFEDNVEDLVHALKETSAAVPTLVLKTCERALDAFEANRRGPLMYHAEEALELVLRAYADADERGTKDRALDLVDRALRLDVYGVNKLLADHDRWWGNS